MNFVPMLPAFTLVAVASVVSKGGILPHAQRRT